MITIKGPDANFKIESAKQLLLNTASDADKAYYLTRHDRWREAAIRLLLDVGLATEDRRSPMIRMLDDPAWRTRRSNDPS